jgi:hypothetical protein
MPFVPGNLGSNRKKWENPKAPAGVQASRSQEARPISGLGEISPLRRRAIA